MPRFHVKHTACNADHGGALVTALALAAGTAWADSSAMGETPRPSFPCIGKNIGSSRVFFNQESAAWNDSRPGGAMCSDWDPALSNCGKTCSVDFASPAPD